MSLKFSSKKDPDAVLDYVMDWSDWLGTDTITTSTWTVPSDITQNSHTHNTTTSTIWLSGGTAGSTYALLNHITTAGGRTDERTVYLSVKQL